MTYKTLEVILENGRVHPCSAETFPSKARGLLTLLDTYENVEDAKGCLADRVANLAGIGQGNFSDLSTNEAHTNNFGK